MSIDWSMLASIFSSLAGIAASATAAYLGKLRYLAYRRRNDAILEAKKRGDTELVKSLTDLQPPVPSFIPPILLAFGLGASVAGHMQIRPQCPVSADMSIQSEQYFTNSDSDDESEAKKCCPGGCEPGSRCNRRSCACEAVANQPGHSTKGIDTALVRGPYRPLESQVLENVPWEPRDCKLNDCYLL